MRKTDEEVWLDYCNITGDDPSEQGSFQREVMVRWVHFRREDEPRINCGKHLVDYINICDKDGTMDTASQQEKDNEQA